jgi:hypothetical protein
MMLMGVLYVYHALLEDIHMMLDYHFVQAASPGVFRMQSDKVLVQIVQGDFLLRVKKTLSVDHVLLVDFLLMEQPAVRIVLLEGIRRNCRNQLATFVEKDVSPLSQAPSIVLCVLLGELRQILEHQNASFVLEDFFQIIQLVHAKNVHWVDIAWKTLVLVQIAMSGRTMVYKIHLRASYVNLENLVRKPKRLIARFVVSERTRTLLDLWHVTIVNQALLDLAVVNQYAIFVAQELSKINTVNLHANCVLKEPHLLRIRRQSV